MTSSTGHDYYLKQLGVTQWGDRGKAVSMDANEVSSPEQEQADVPEVTRADIEPGNISMICRSKESTVEERKPQPEASKAEEVKPHEPSKSSISVSNLASAEMSWEELEQAVGNCHLCDLCASRTNTVFGVGNRQADILVIGEAPGADEDAQGEPFVGRAGKLLDNMLAAIGQSRSTVFIANILKCRPPNNRDPLAEEVVCCVPYLKRQIELIQPKLILTIGRIAAQNLLDTQTPIGKMRGKDYTYSEAEIPVIVSYHPAYLLRSPGAKAEAWKDLKRVLNFLNNC